MQNLYLDFPARKNKVRISTGNSPLDIAITKQARTIIQNVEVSNTKFAPASKEWVNSVYSFNPNYIKPLSMVDIMVNKLVKSYFNFTKLIWKKKYKFNTVGLKDKFRLIKRRKRAEIKKNKLSLNKVLVSRGEMKHSNNKVIATFYIFNRAKKFLLYKLNSLSTERETFSLSKAQNLLNKNSPERGKKASQAFISFLASSTTTKNQVNKKIRKNNPVNKKNDKVTQPLNLFTYINKKQTNAIKQIPSYAKIFNLTSTPHSLKNKETSAYLAQGEITAVKPVIYRNKPKYLNSTNLRATEKQTSSVNNYYNHIYLSNLTKKRLSRFIYKINNTDIKNKYITLMKNLYGGLGKYKLYNVHNLSNNNDMAENFMFSVNTINLPNNVFNAENVYLRLSAFYRLLNRTYTINLSRYSKYFNIDKPNKKNLFIFSSQKEKKSTFMVQILKSFYKSFALYNVKNIVYNANDLLFESSPRSNIALHNRKLYINKVNNSTGNITNKEMYLLNTLSKSEGQTPSSTFSLIEKKINKTKTMKLKTIKLINKIRRYKKFIIKSLAAESLNTNPQNSFYAASNVNNFNKRFISYERNCIQNFLKKTYRKELLYIRYVKMLLFNNNRYKSHYILGLKNVVSKLYNKKVEFNFVNLKYLYLNSDILSGSIATRLRNRQNRLLTVLSKAVLLVNIPSINNKWEFTPSHLGRREASKNIKNKKSSSIISLFLANKIRTMSSSVLCLAKGVKNNDGLNLLLKNLYLNNAPCSIKSKNLSLTQKNALHSVNNKAVFGVRLEASGRLTKRLTASRSVSKLKYRGSIKNFNSSNYGLSSVMLKGNLRSNLQYTKISNKTRNGSFGLKGWVSAY